MVIHNPSCRDTCWTRAVSVAGDCSYTPGVVVLAGDKGQEGSAGFDVSRLVGINLVWRLSCVIHMTEGDGLCGGRLVLFTRFQVNSKGNVSAFWSS